MEDGAVIKAVFDVLQKIGHRVRGLFRVQFQGDVTQTRFQFYQGFAPFVPGCAPGGDDRFFAVII